MYLNHVLIFEKIFVEKISGIKIIMELVVSCSS